MRGWGCSSRLAEQALTTLWLGWLRHTHMPLDPPRSIFLVTAKRPKGGHPDPVWWPQGCSLHPLPRTLPPVNPSTPLLASTCDHPAWPLHMWHARRKRECTCMCTQGKGR